MAEGNENADRWKYLKTVSLFDKKKTKIIDVSKKNSGLFSPSSLLIESLIDYICILTEKDRPKQKQLYFTICQKLHDLQLIDDSFLSSDFDFIRSHYQKELYRLINVAKSVSPVVEQYNVPVPALSREKTWRNGNKLFEWSRYSNEYYELEFIARGGFGEVVKVQNKLDAGIYAIKKICLKYCSMNGFFRGLCEVQMLAKLNHPNIVSYKAAWLEPLLNIRKIEKSKMVAGSDDTSDSKKENDSTGILFLESDPSRTNEDEYDADSTSSTDDRLEYDHPIDDRSSFSDRNLDKNSFDYKKPLSVKKNPDVHTCGQDWAVLFIQMQLCHETLRQWLDRRNATSTILVDIQESIGVFMQIVRGVEFIHSKGIVHHDIKPSNIFVSQNGKEVQVGDFGLSCCLLHDVCPDSAATTIFSSSNCPVSVTHQPGEIGTKLYAAPEQLRGVCNFKSDLFSLGIMLFELVYSFHTSMERVEKINNLRKGIFPSDLETVFPNIVKLIKRLVAENWDTRPTATELLKEISDISNDFCDDDVNISNTITRLKEELFHKDEEIDTLKKQLESLKNS